MRRLIACVACGLLSAASLVAQNAQISGVKKDASSAVVPNAAVTALNKDTGAKRKGQSTAMAKDQIGGGASTAGGQSFGLNGLFQVGGPRSVQLSLKLSF